ncbi:site-specific recombinase [Solimicrobium silvestre]|uniref:Site-specific recombinase n=1 Tax=Solimicrobium silvestre TaxID=2099400 RepID=A0A2S9GZW2_9BURK|nr:site-specific recombinase [Solimicrobium silvestre]PRC93240.1 Site-specific recombinase [Solimicrobium silvestre]
MSIDFILEQIANTPTSSDTELIRDLVAAIRPKHADNIELATDRLHALSFKLTAQPKYAVALRNYLFELVSSRKITHLCTDTGITLSEGFWSAAWQRLLYKFLPPLVNNDYLRDVIGTIFHQVDDHVWINGVDEQVWLDLIDAIGFRIRGAHVKQKSNLNELMSAMQVLSYRISAIGLESELVRNYPSIERYESPFLRQNDEINDYIKEYRNWVVDHSAVHRDSQQIEVLLAQCEEIVIKIRRTAAQQGVSVSLTRLLLRVTESIARLRIMLALIEAPNKKQTLHIGFRLFKELVYFDNRKYSIRELIGTNTQLLTMQVTEHAGRSGEHYVASNRREWVEMLRSASGAGFIVGFMATMKILMSKLLLAPFGYAFLFSLNYSLGFMLVHIMHFTIATKQPAMTAALIAKSLDQSKHKLDDLCELVVQVIRTQFIAILGNVAIAIPTAYAIAWAWYSSTGHHLVDPDKARHLLDDINPFASLSLFHAAIAGVCLFLSGLISGYYDNKASYSHIPERLLQLSSMQWLFGMARWKRMTDYIGNNLGALAGNFFFGIMLGSIGQIGVFLGLPIDIRHITFSSANFAFALVGLEHQLTWQVWVISLVGIVLIGIVNLAVSFSLALFVAMRSRGVSFEQTGELIALLWKRFIKHGRDFFFPPKEMDLPESGSEHGKE